ncbi:MAG: signal peptide peptidase SppA [Chitinophagaceae bacterium]
MKDFFKYFLASLLSSIVIFVVGIIIVFIILFAIVGGVSSKLVSDQNEVKKLDENYILVVDLGIPYPDRVAYNHTPFIKDEDTKDAMDLYTLQKALQHATTNNKIKAIYIKATNNVNGWVINKEIRDAILSFKEKSKKPVFAYAQNYSQQSYFLSSVADSLYIDPAGYIAWQGMGISMLFYKNLLQKIGIGMQVFYVGKYKSATEPFREDKMTSYNKEQLMDILNTYYSIVLENTSKGRDLSMNTLKEYADNLLLIDAEQAVKNHMITHGVYYHQMENILKNVVSDDDKPALLSMQDYVNSIEETSIKQKIAVVYMEGTIAKEENAISAKKYRKIFRKIIKEDNIKAVVLRINSPGGDAQESENIWQEIRLLKAKKPVIVSMGNMAASGGYYISSAADSIYALPMTITGSIGIFGMIPEAKQLAHKVGITYDEVHTAPHANMPIFGLDDVQKKAVQKMLQIGYDLFIKRVAQGRHKIQEQVDIIAQGRVWTGVQAKSLGLVDGWADLDSCIKIAAHMSKLKSYSPVMYPEPLSWMERVKNQFKGYISITVQEAIPILQYLNVDKHMQNINFILQQQGQPLVLLPGTIEIK